MDEYFTAENTVKHYGWLEYEFVLICTYIDYSQLIRLVISAEPPPVSR